MEKGKSINILILMTSILVLGMIMLSSCTKNTSGTAVKPRGRAYFDLFDTVSYIYSYKGDSEEEYSENADEAYNTLLYFHRLFDIYHEYDGIKNLCYVNSHPGEKIKVERDLLEFLLYAREMSEVTRGKMDVMMGSVLSLWHDARYSEKPYLPDEGKLRMAGEYTGFDYLEIDEMEGTVTLLSPFASIDVGALGKGYATEKAAAVLEKKGVSGYVLNIGGNIRIIGTKPDGSGWKTGIRDPENPDSDFIVKLTLKDTSCVTSGSYERYFTVDGVRYSHIIDPETLYPASFFESVTVITENSALADALSTALFCMSYEDGAELASSLSVDVIWVFAGSDVKYTEGIEALLTE